MTKNTRKSNITTKTITLTFGQLKDIFELMSKQVVEEGKGAEYSFMLVENFATLGKFYGKGMGAIYDPNKDMEWKAFQQGQQSIINKYAEKNADGSIMVQNGQPVISKAVNKFQAEMTNLQQAYAGAIDRANKAPQKNAELFAEVYRFPVKAMPIECFPWNAHPIIVWAFALERECEA